MLLVTDEMLLKLGLVQPLLDEMKNVGLDGVVYSEVVPNPTIKNIEDGLKVYHDNGCDLSSLRKMP